MEGRGEEIGERKKREPGGRIWEDLADGFLARGALVIVMVLKTQRPLIQA